MVTVWHLTYPDNWANIWSAKCVFSQKKKKIVLCKLNRFYKLKIGLDRQKIGFCNPVLPYPIPSYLIPSLPHPTRILNTILHLYKILLLYPIILKLNRIDPRPKRLGSVHHQNLPRPKSHGWNDPNSVVCTAKILKSFGLVYSPILRLKNVFWREFTGKSEAVHTPLNVNKADTLRNRT